MSDVGSGESGTQLGLSKEQLDAIAAALADREAEEVLADTAMPAAEEPPPGQPRPIDRVSARAADLIIRHETGGQAYYRQVVKERAVWPRGPSGITIGFGYDLGYVDAARFRSDWRRCRLRC